MNRGTKKYIYNKEREIVVIMVRNIIVSGFLKVAGTKD